MPGRASSLTYVGRRAQLDALRRALVDVGRQHGHVVLVGGEAGIGKTRLVDEFGASVSSTPTAGRPVRVIRGTCSELAAGSLPYLPILDLVDGLGASGGDAAALARIRADLAGSGDDAADADSRSNTFLAFRDAVVEAAVDVDLVLVVDDLHWADRSTLELLAFVAPRLGDARVLLVGAYRTDELHRRHPLRPVLVELEHAGSLAHLRLEPLSPEDVGAQLEAITGAALPAANLARIVELADGNPFYVEELAALDPASARLPPSLRDLLAARLTRFSDATLDVLAGAAVIGRDVDPALLDAIVDSTNADVATALADAAQQHVVEPTSDGRRYRFRHALLAEAVRDGLLPAERIGLHRRLAETLAARPELGAESPAGAAAELAHHWTEAGDGTHALPAWIEAGRSASVAHAWQESASAYERALALDAAGSARLEPGRRAELGMRAAMMTSLAGEPRRAYELAVSAIAEDDGSDAVQSALRWVDYSGLANDAGEFEQERLAADRSVALMPTEPPTVDLARVVVGHVSSQMLHGAYRAAIAEADEALRICRLVGEQDGELEIMGTRALALASLGQAEAAREAAAWLTTSIASRDRAVSWHIGTAVTNTLASLIYAGEFGVAMAYAEHVDRFVTGLGVERAWQPWLDSDAANAAFHLGRWADATARLDRLAASEPVGFLAWGHETVSVLLNAARGQPPRTDATVNEPEDWSDPGMRGDQWCALARAALWGGDIADAVRLADRAVDAVADTENISILAGAVWVASRAWADASEAARAGRRADELATALRRVDELAAIDAAIGDGSYLDGASATPWMRIQLAEADAERLRAHGRSDPTAWRRVAVAHDGRGTRPFAAYARYREAEAALAASDRDTATAALGEASAVAADLGAAPLTAMIDGLARRARLEIGSAPAAIPDPTTRDPWGLSARELEVLGLVGEGRTNREIGEALFISTKTASVHVTHILTKLGVSSRTEAALLAARAGIGGPGTVSEG